MVWSLDSSHLIKGNLSGAPHDHPNGLFYGGYIDFSIYLAVLQSSLSLHTFLYNPLNRLKVPREWKIKLMWSEVELSSFISLAVLTLL